MNLVSATAPLHVHAPFVTNLATPPPPAFQARATPTAMSVTKAMNSCREVAVSADAGHTTTTLAQALACSALHFQRLKLGWGNSEQQVTANVWRAIHGMHLALRRTDATRVPHGHSKTNLATKIVRPALR